MNIRQYGDNLQGENNGTPKPRIPRKPSQWQSAVHYGKVRHCSQCHKLTENMTIYKNGNSTF